MKESEKQIKKKEILVSGSIVVRLLDSVTTPSTQFEKYLGLPSIIGRAKQRAFNEIKDQIWKRLQGGRRNCYPKLEEKSSSRLLFRLSIHMLWVFLNFLLGYVRTFAQWKNWFWWGQLEGNRKVHCLSKQKLIKPK